MGAAVVVMEGVWRPLEVVGLEESGEGLSAVVGELALDAAGSLHGLLGLDPDVVGDADDGGGGEPGGPPGPAGRRGGGGAAAGGRGGGRLSL